ncbi:hypothetical protein G7Z17_g7681 [Cylindrodendrum hubeiense]|uniref:Major facilitator superfamily (MFS) profile domain-containing protein n=1 Tax=Cylindrodendrum hubeiense TaxID=595255 RepID=A0A9P5H3C3_9HYPO|nr:hypothetical protein G7Z17_g7681 [Cylindrodendrum hubeiense]
MAAEEGHDQSTTATTEKSEQQSPEDICEEHAVEDPERNTAQEIPGGLREETSKDESPSWSKLVLIGIGLWFAVFLYALDQTIVSNAIPSITDDFKKTSDEGWYGSGYLLTTAAFQLLYGRIYSNFSIKYTFLVAITIFELGSLICGLAPTSTVLIVGRAVAGVGGAGIASGAFIIIAHSFPLRIRPMCIASMGMVYAVASVLGPVLGGVFTSKLTWRWCFYINLPFGGVTILAILLFLQSPDRPEINSIPVSERLKKIDLIGLLIFIPAIVCLLLALQWGGSAYAWSNGRIIALLVFFGVLVIAFLAFEYWKGDETSLPIRVITKRSVAAATWNAFCNLATFLVLVYYIPLWHQVVRDASAADAGVRLLPFVLGVVIMANLSGALVSKFGYYAPMMILSSIITPIGMGLMSTWTVDASFSEWVGYQAIVGLGLGLGQQQPMVAIQTILPKSEVPAGISIIMLTQTLSGAIFVSVGQSVLQNDLVENLEVAFPNGGIDISKLSSVGATQVRSLVPPEDLHTVLVAYNSALTKIKVVILDLRFPLLCSDPGSKWPVKDTVRVFNTLIAEVMGHKTYALDGADLGFLDAWHQYEECNTTAQVMRLYFLPRVPHS